MKSQQAAKTRLNKCILASVGYLLCEERTVRRAVPPMRYSRLLHAWVGGAIVHHLQLGHYGRDPFSHPYNLLHLHFHYHRQLVNSDIFLFSSIDSVHWAYWSSTCLLIGLERDQWKISFFIDRQRSQEKVNWTNIWRPFQMFITELAELWKWLFYSNRSNAGLFISSFSSFGPSFEIKSKEFSSVKLTYLK